MDKPGEFDRQLAAELWRQAAELEEERGLLSDSNRHSQVFGLVTAAIKLLESARDLLMFENS